MTNDDIKTLRALVDAATQADADGYPLVSATGTMHLVGPPVAGNNYDEKLWQVRADAALWNAARSALPLLLDRVEELERERDAARRERDAFSYDTLTRERNQLADEVREQADDLLGLQELAPPVELLSRICKQAHEWRIRLANVQLRLDVAEIADDPTADVWRRESSRVDVLTAARDKLAAECEDLRKQSESWRLAHFAWQQWGDRMRQLVACTLNGDEPTREAIERRATAWRDQRDSARTRALKAEADRDRLRTLLAEAVEIARTLGDQAEANADRDDDGWMSQYVNISTRLAAIAKEGLT